MLTYVIGDIHGRADLLAPLLAAIEDHRAGRPRHLVFLGDYIDRGPGSAAVIATLRALEAREPGHVVCLAGNHEDILVRALTDPADETDWMTNGGAGPTLASYGVTRVADLPRDVLDWLAALRTLHRDTRRYYVHAGLRPGRGRPRPRTGRPGSGSATPSSMPIAIVPTPVVNAASPCQPSTIAPQSIEITSPSCSTRGPGMPWMISVFTLAQITAGNPW